MQLSRNRQRDPVQLGIKIQIDATAMQKFWQYVDLAKAKYLHLAWLMRFAILILV